MNHDQFIHAYMPLSARQYAEYLRRITPEGKTMETIEKTWSQQFVEQGALEARREILEHQIRTRFGAIPAPLAERIATADRQTLDLLLDRVVLAHSIDEIAEEPA